jgi:hypothetical protein
VLSPFGSGLVELVNSHATSFQIIACGLRPNGFSFAFSFSVGLKQSERSSACVSAYPSEGGRRRFTYKQF